MTAALRPPWRDRHGRFVPIKAVVLFLVCIPATVLAVQWATGSLGAKPVTEVIHGLGLWTIRFLLITLAVTPARGAFNWSRIVLVRRMLGLTTLAYAVAHLCMYAYDQNLMLLHVASEIVHRFYLTIGFVTLLGLIALGVTSTDGSMRRMGKNWKRLHRIVYGLAVLGLLHYFIQSKANVSGAVVTSGLFVWLMLWRQVSAGWQRSPVTLVGLAIGSALATAGIEAMWYALATKINVHRVLEANLSLSFGPRPAAWVGIIALGVGAAIVGWRLVGSSKRKPPQAPAGPGRLVSQPSA